MPRTKRIYLPGYWYHVCCRGQRKQPLFFSPEDNIFYLKKLDETLKRFNTLLGGFCLMKNHTHLLLKMINDPFGKIFKSLNTSYANYFNKKRKTVGHVFQGRPQIKIIVNEIYLHTVIEYIHNNPVKANLVQNSLEYPWSSVNVNKNGKFQNFILESWYPVKISSKNILNAEFCEHFIGSKKEYIELEKRNSEKCNQYYTDNRKNLNLETIVLEEIADSKYSINELKIRTKNKSLIKFRNKIIKKLYYSGFGLTEIALFFDRTPSTILNSINILK